MNNNDNNYGPGGITWSHTNVATIPEIVAAFNALHGVQILQENWCGAADWHVTDETYINGVILTLDFDYMMGFLVEAVDRTSSQCTYIAITQYHGRGADGSIDHDFLAWEGVHTFFGKDDGFDQAKVCQWAVSTIYSMVEAHNERR